MASVKHNTTTNKIFMHLARPWAQGHASSQPPAAPLLPPTGNLMLDAFLNEPMGHGPFHTVGAVLLGVVEGRNGAGWQDMERTIITAATYGGSDASVRVGSDDPLAGIDYWPPSRLGDARQRDIDLLGVGEGIPEIVVGDVADFMHDIDAVLDG